ncbi:MAG: hypothetical protein WB341_08360 [Terracidiphilus sp.]
MWITAASLLVPAALVCTLPAAAQYPGQITNPDKNTPELRAVAVFEWTGDQDHPKASRLIPICVFDGQDLEDGGIYLAQPEPLALQSEVEYQLLQDGEPVGLFVVDSAGQQQGTWVGFGKLRPLPKPKPASEQLARVDEEDVQSDVPILHRKHHSGDSSSGSSSGSGSGSGSGSEPDANAPPPDPDRPTLHKGGDASSSTSGDSSGSSSSGSGASGAGSTQASSSGGPTLHKGGDASSGSSGDSGSSGSDANAPPPDPNRPILRNDDDSSSGSASSGGSNRPKLKKKNDDDEAYVSDVATLTNPDRPHLFYGKTAGYAAPVLPSLIGLPPEMHQEVAVSDAMNRPVHVWDYTWADPDDAAKMKTAMEDLARTALGLSPPPAPAAKPAPKTASAHKTAKPAPPPAPLLVEQFSVFELAYGSGATMVISAHSAGVGEQEKFVTLVAQPDLYGNVAVLLKNVTDAAHLDDTPRMKLIDAVDARADNRGELLFELRGATQRQFALYRVLRGDATRIFLSGADAIGVPGSN